MPMYSGLFYIDLEYLEGEEASFDLDKLKTLKEMEKHLEELKKQKEDIMPRVKPIVDSGVHSICISPDGHTLASSGKDHVHFISAVTLDLVTSVKCSTAAYMKITNYHAFIKHALDAEWTMISFKKTNYLSDHECKVKISDVRRLQYIISNDNLKDVFGIYAPSLDPQSEEYEDFLEL
jgi:WD40 repeat protein